MISAIMPVYNAAAFLRQAIEGILNQTEKNFEFIIVNDGSTDESEAIILSYTDLRIRYIKKENGGEASARNTGLENAKGDFIVWQDADDVSLPMRFEILRRNFIAPSVGFVHSDFLVINEKDQPIAYWQSRSIEKARMLRFFLRSGTPFNNPSMMLRREMLEGFIYDTTLKVGTDTDMVFQLARNWDSVHVPEPLVLYRRHSNNLTVQKNYVELESVHFQKFLNRHSLEELFPELDWKTGGLDDNKARASILIAMFLSRRAMIANAQSWYEKAINSVNSVDSKIFVHAITNLINGKPEFALGLLSTCANRDHVVENYMGECAALLGQTEKAYLHFMRALELRPNYDDAVDNIKGLAGITKFRQVDSSWIKFGYASTHYGSNVPPA